jgi:SAM-dependent methyltransferase
LPRSDSDQSMKQNIYDNPTFFEGYAQLRRHESGLNAALEWPALHSMLPPLGGLRVLDLGCGFGKWTRLMREQGAASVVGIDISAKMLERARAENAMNGITYLKCPIEDAAFDPGSFGLVTSSLAFHYVERFDLICSNVARWLEPGGAFVFSVEHPILTANPANLEGWCRDAAGAKRHWALDNYRDEGVRSTRWFVDGVIKYHRTIETYLNTLIDSGLAIARVLEPEATPETVRSQPELAQERRRPPFLLIAARRA